MNRILSILKSCYTYKFAYSKNLELLKHSIKVSRDDLLQIYITQSAQRSSQV